MKKKNPKPIYETDKYGLMYQVNKPLSENDKKLIEQLKQLMSKPKN